MIGGNTTIAIQIINGTTRDQVGSRVPIWETVRSLKGWLDLSSGDSKRTTFNAKIQESTHIFLCDYASLIALGTEWLWNDIDFEFSFISDLSGEKITITPENSRVIDEDGHVYDVMLLDDPMKMHKHLEIYLKYTGGQ